LRIEDSDATVARISEIVEERIRIADILGVSVAQHVAHAYFYPIRMKMIEVRRVHAIAVQGVRVAIDLPAHRSYAAQHSNHTASRQGHASWIQS
jgi:hypothetical protein